MNLVVAESFHANPADYGRGDAPVPAWSLMWHSDHFKTRAAADLPTQTTKAFSGIAFVSAGRWSVKCLWCPTSEYASITDHWMMCAACYNNHMLQWIPVVWPDDTTVQIIDGILGLREVKNRHWEPSETIIDLAFENERYGIPTFDRFDIPKLPEKTWQEYHYNKMMANLPPSVNIPPTPLPPGAISIPH